jgi:hypothetical protein
MGRTRSSLSGPCDRHLLVVFLLVSPRTSRGNPSDKVPPPGKPATCRAQVWGPLRCGPMAHFANSVNERPTDPVANQPGCGSARRLDTEDSISNGVFRRLWPVLAV